MIDLSIGHIKDGSEGRRCDRATPLGNPFEMKTEADRDPVCDAFQEYHDGILAGRSPENSAESAKISWSVPISKRFKFPTREEYLNALAGIKKGDRLLCWCASKRNPKRCHCQTLVSHKQQEWASLDKELLSLD